MPPRLSLAFLALFTISCTPPEGVPDAGPPAVPSVELLGAYDLSRETRTEGLSGTVYAEATRTLYALKDTEPVIVPITVSDDNWAFTPGSPIALTGRPRASWDGEGLTRAADGSFIAVSVETIPLVERFTAGGAYVGEVELPARFADQPAGNMGVESLSLSPSGTYLFFANEGALTSDGAIADQAMGTRIRIHRRNLASGGDEEHAYFTEPVGPGVAGTSGVSDVTAISDERVLVLERGFQLGYGNTVRIYLVELASGPDVSHLDALGPSTPVVSKTLVVDLATLPAVGIANPSPQPNPILDNYEGLALGPLLSDGRRIVFVTSDDNQNPGEVARILTLALRL